MAGVRWSEVGKHRIHEPRFVPLSYAPAETFIVPPNQLDALLKQDLLDDLVCICSIALTKRERDVLLMRHCLELTYREIGRRLSVSATRVLSLEHRALRKMRHPWRGAIPRRLYHLRYRLAAPPQAWDVTAEPRLME